MRRASGGFGTFVRREDTPTEGLELVEMALPPLTAQHVCNEKPKSGKKLIFKEL